MLLFERILQFSSTRVHWFVPDESHKMNLPDGTVYILQTMAAAYHTPLRTLGLTFGAWITLNNHCLTCPTWMLISADFLLIEMFTCQEGTHQQSISEAWHIVHKLNNHSLTCLTCWFLTYCEIRMSMRSSSRPSGTILSLKHQWSSTSCSINWS